MLAGGPQPGGHRLLRNAEGGRDLAVAVPVVVPEDERRGLLWRQLLERAHEIGALRRGARIGRRGRPSQASHDLTSLAKPLVAAVGDRQVDRDPVQPGLDRRVRAPGLPAPVSALVGLLGAVFGRRLVADDRDQRAEDAAVGVAVQPFEVGFRTWFVMLRRRYRPRCGRLWLAFWLALWGRHPH